MNRNSSVEYDCIVVGAGHAGTEAALAAEKMGCEVLLVTMNLDSIGALSCNPAIGGIGKGQLVKEMDALGGFMGIAADACGIQFRMLNSSKGPAVRSSRAQIDMARYRIFVKSHMERRTGLHLRQAEVVSLLAADSKITGVKLDTGEEIRARTTIITCGTFLGGLLHIGLNHFPGGRLGEAPSKGLSQDLKNLGFKVGRFKTGTCPRIDARSINFEKLIRQDGDNPIRPFSFSTDKITLPQVPCHITYTNLKTHDIIRSGLNRSPLYTGKIKSTGVRYCPSVEDKIVRFPDRDRHQIFLEPQGLDTVEIYPNGLSTSLPFDIQYKMLNSIEGLESARIMRPGYGIEHDYIDSTQVFQTLQTKLFSNLFMAGQINGTTGYEEAAAQGLVAGINAALQVKEREPFVLERDESYIGVLIDDLTTKGTNEPYRMFTSRVEYRLILREDNADLRLREHAYKLGLVSERELEKLNEKKRLISQGKEYFKLTRLKPSEINEKLNRAGCPNVHKAVSLEELLKRPQLSMKDMLDLNHIKENVFAEDEEVLRQIEIEIKYDGFIKRQFEEVARFKRIERIKIPKELDYGIIKGLSSEIIEKLKKFNPVSVGQASRISGVTPAAISLLMVYINKLQREGENREKH